MSVVTNLLAILALTVLIMRLLGKLRKPNQQQQLDPVKRVKLMVVLGSGGHTAEMLRLLPHLNFNLHSSSNSNSNNSKNSMVINYWPRVYVSAETDAMSENKARQFELDVITKSTKKKSQMDAKYLRIPRSREVGQSWPSTLWSFCMALKASLSILLEQRPQCILCNGPGTCVPICLAAYALNWIGIIGDCKVVFVESCARVTSLSMTGRILYYLADLFIVQWPDLVVTIGNNSNNRIVYIDSLLFPSH